MENRLKIRHPYVAQFAGDDVLRAKAEQILAWSPDIDQEKIEITARSGLLRLEGTVDALWKKHRAEELVLTFAGVLDVENRLSVVPTRRPTDQEIADRLTAALARNVLVSPETINVKVEDGRVMLSGSVPSVAARRAAHETGLYTTGVTDVENRITVVERTQPSEGSGETRYVFGGSTRISLVSAREGSASHLRVSAARQRASLVKLHGFGEIKPVRSPPPGRLRHERSNEPTGRPTVRPQARSAPGSPGGRQPIRAAECSRWRLIRRERNFR